jgi:molybdopterin-guanine dinucleotide biosynthesis protein A
MGRDKALLPFSGAQGLTFATHLASLLASLCSDVVLVARDLAHAEECAATGVRVVADSVSGIGPLMGLYSGLCAIESSHALVTAVDMPLLQPAMVSFLLSQPLDEALLVPVVDDVPQVLLAVYPRSLLPVIEELLRGGRRDPRSLLAVAAVHYITEAQLRAVDPQLRSFVNVNTPEDLSNYKP